MPQSHALSALAAGNAIPASQPNELDWRRIERALEQRVRYRYVTPEVQAIAHGYRIVSPCCSRNIDPEGGAIDIAWLEFVDAEAHWRLYAMDHEQHAWVLQAAGRLHELLALLNEDPQRVFWQ